MKEPKYISPVPKVWHEIHQALESFWNTELQKKGDKPPTPLILAGWNYSSDFEKSERWQATVRCAEEMNCSTLIKELKNDEKYYG